MGSPLGTAPLTDPPGRLAASLAGRYRLERELGRGGLRRYVALREDAAPALRAEVDSARERLAMLVGR